MSSPDAEPLSDAESIPDADKSRPGNDWFHSNERSTLKRSALFIAGNLLPSFCLLWLTADTSLEPQWQTGKIHDYAAFLLSGRTIVVFFPFLVYSISCFTLSLYRPKTARRLFFVRFGVYSGIIVSLQYCLILGVSVFQVEDLTGVGGLVKVLVGIPLMAAIAIGTPWGLWSLTGVIRRTLVRLGGKRWWLALLMFGAPLGAFAIGTAAKGDSTQAWMALAVIAPGLLVVMSTPYWMIAVYTAAAWKLARGRAKLQVRLLDMLGVVTWVAAYIAAWRYAVVEAVTVYTELPTSPPSGCYIATAAARGHRWLVRSRVAPDVDGGTRWVNMQLAYFKCGELVLARFAPGVHRLLRRAYDTAGPPVARRLGSPWLCDAAYVTLKPFEWLVRLVLSMVLSDAATHAARLYGMDVNRQGRAAVQMAGDTTQPMSPP